MSPARYLQLIVKQTIVVLGFCLQEGSDGDGFSTESLLRPNGYNAKTQQGSDMTKVAHER